MRHNSPCDIKVDLSSTCSIKINYSKESPFISHSPSCSEYKQNTFRTQRFLTSSGHAHHRFLGPAKSPKQRKVGHGRTRRRGSLQIAKCSSLVEFRLVARAKTSDTESCLGDCEAALSLLKQHLLKEQAISHKTHHIPVCSLVHEGRHYVAASR